MFYLCFLIWVCINPSYAQQFYDPSDCSSDPSQPGTTYTCNSSQNSCQTFLVFRANPHFQTISTISDLFQMESADQVLQLNNLTSPTQILKLGRDVLVPINCSCSDHVFQANFSYTVPEITTFSEVACGVFESLLKSVTLAEENPSRDNDLQAGSKLRVSLRCACPENVTVKFLVTYPLIEGDGPDTLSNKFGISGDEIWAANHLEPGKTVFPNTTILIPLKTFPVINLSFPDSPPPIAGFLPTIPTEKTAKNTKLRNLYIAGSAVGFTFVLVAFLACLLYVRTLKKWKGQNLQSFNARSSPISCSTARSSPRSGQTGRSSTNSCLSPELLIGIKYSLSNYSIEELKKATGDFSEDNKIGNSAYKALIDDVEVMIKQMRFEDMRHVIDVHSKLNHINIVNLHGVCYADSDSSWSYLVFELPINGCIRDCLLDSSNPLGWHRRTQIAFDVATGLHYLHHCIFPTYAHMNVNTRNIFLTADWRAKLANIGTSTSTDVSGWIAPEHIVNSAASEKVDIFAFGVVLLELISAREDMDGGNVFRGAIGFLGGGVSEGGCFDQLRSFMDPELKEEYPLTEALCLAVLAKACVEDDPLHRPSMDDIIKVLARMV